MLDVFILFHSFHVMFDYLVYCLQFGDEGTNNYFRLVTYVGMTSSCSHMPSAASEKKRLRSWYAVIADKCAFPRTDSYAVTAVRLECLFVRNSDNAEYNVQMQVGGSLL